MFAIEKELDGCFENNHLPLNRNSHANNHINPYHQHSIQLQLPVQFPLLQNDVKHKNEGRRTLSQILKRNKIGLSVLK